MTTTGTSIFLIGPMGVGKSTVGRALAKLVQMEFLDTDVELEKRTGASVALIFDVEGESGFRKRESAVLAELTALPRIVLATGGGIVLAEENRKMLRRGRVAYLSADVETLYERTRSSKKRPLLNTEDPHGAISALKEHREPLYKSEADVEIQTDHRSAMYVAREIVKALDEL